MDNKITKRRLSRFFTYEWFVLVAVIVAVILAWEFLFSLTSVKLTRDDRFYYYYDVSMDDGNATDFYNQITGANSIFSYGVQEVTDTILFGDYTQFNAFITALDGDAMFTLASGEIDVAFDTLLALIPDLVARSIQSSVITTDPIETRISPIAFKLFNKIWKKLS